MPARLEIVGETWYIYVIVARERYHDVTLPVSTYMACKRSERGRENYERAWQRYLRAAGGNPAPCLRRVTPLRAPRAL
jgi:hypothetical protein